LSGEDLPRVVLPSVAIELDPAQGSNQQRSRRPESRECYKEYADNGTEDTEVQEAWPVERGVLDDVADMDVLLGNVFNYELGLQPEIHQTVMLTEAPLCTRAKRAEMSELMFETFKVPALSTCNTAVLSLFAAGRTRGLVLECGAGVSHVVPVFEGFPLNHAVLRLDVAGQDVTQRLNALLLQHGVQHNQHYDVVRDMKEKLCCVAAAAPSTSSSSSSAEVQEYELPDGGTVRVAAECCSAAAEVLFSPAAEGDLCRGKEQPNGGLADMVMASIAMCDQHVQPDLLRSVVLSGGSTLLPGFSERVQTEVDKLALASKTRPADAALPVVVPHPSVREPGYNGQRKYAAWIGGSILASLSTFKLMQVSRQEYEDAGASVMHRKCL
jgi:actin, other eukaryote